jgi:hypothetical protein
VRTTAGAGIVAVARYKTTTTSVAGIGNSKGIGALAFRIGNATVGFTVKVAVTVTKGAQKATCATSFTPTRAVSVPNPPPAAPKVTVTPSLNGSIGIAWSESSAGVTRYKVLLTSPVKTIINGSYPATSNGTTVQYGSPLANVCTDDVVPDTYTGSIIATSAAGNSPPTAISGHMPRSGPPTPAAPTATGGYRHVDLNTGPLPCPVNKVRITHTSYPTGTSDGQPVALITDLPASHSLDGLAGGVPSCPYYCYFNYQYTFQISACAAGGSPCTPWGPTSNSTVIYDALAPTTPTSATLSCSGMQWNWVEPPPTTDQEYEAGWGMFLDNTETIGSPTYEWANIPLPDPVPADFYTRPHTLIVWAIGRDGQLSGRYTTTATCTP